MKQLKLSLDDLNVDSFDTSAASTGKGTIFGEQCTCYTNCTCPGCPTCDASCDGTCNASCDGTCGPGCGPGTQTNGDTCFVSCNVSECYQGTACVVW